MERKLQKRRLDALTAEEVAAHNYRHNQGSDDEWLEEHNRRAEAFNRQSDAARQRQYGHMPTLVQRLYDDAVAAGGTVSADMPLSGSVTLVIHFDPVVAEKLNKRTVKGTEMSAVAAN